VHRLPTRSARPWRRVAIVAAALAIGAASLAFLVPAHHDGSTPTGENGPWAPAELRGWIAYSSDGDIIVVDPSSTAHPLDRRLLFHPTAGAAWPLSWSPDGTSLLFSWAAPGSSPVPDEADLFVLHDDGQLTRVTTDGRPSVGSFASDGTILYTATTGNIGVVRFDPATGSRMTMIEPDAAWAAWPATSPDGRTIAFIRVDRDGGTSIEIADADGSHQRSLVSFTFPSSVDATGLSWSPDGSRIAFGLYADNALLLDVVNADGSGLRRVTDGGYPSWSPDGSRLALEQEGQLITLRPDGTDPRAMSVQPYGHGWAARVGPWNASSG
jgi:dipeptidyl aminopeptidase/acylaminoacyl peptidase